MNKSLIKSGTCLLFDDHHLLIEILGAYYYPDAGLAPLILLITDIFLINIHISPVAL